jgi:hypothetical protein
MSYANDKVTERRTEAHAAAKSMSNDDLLAASRSIKAVKDIVQRAAGLAQAPVLTQSQGASK